MKIGVGNRSGRAVTAKNDEQSELGQQHPEDRELLLYTVPHGGDDDIEKVIQPIEGTVRAAFHGYDHPITRGDLTWEAPADGRGPMRAGGDMQKT